MRALSVTQPWAAMIAVGAKRVETRSWAPSGVDLPITLLIHAPKSLAGGGGADAINAMCDREPFAGILGRTWETLCGTHAHPEIRRAAERGVLVRWTRLLPRGAIVAIAELARTPMMDTGSINVLRRANPTEHALGLYEPGRYAWILHDVRRFHEPIPCSGQTLPDGARHAQGLWTPDPETVEQVVDRLRGSAVTPAVEELAAIEGADRA